MTAYFGCRQMRGPIARLSALAFCFALLAPCPATAADAPEKNDKFASRSFVEELHRVTISGRALDDAGQPIAGARVYLLPHNADYTPMVLLGQTTTDEAGEYRFADVELPVLEIPPQPLPRPTQGGFQVFGTAEGYGFTWRKTHFYRPQPRQGNIKDPTVFFRDERIAVDLPFSPAARLRGRMTNVAGSPLAGVKLQLGRANTLRDLPGEAPRSYSCTYREGSSREADGSFVGIRHLPATWLETVTDEAGEYEFAGLPRDVGLMAFFDYRPECNPLELRIITAAGEDLGPRRFVGDDGRVDHVFVEPQRLQVRVVGSSDQQPAAAATVQATSTTRIIRAGNVVPTNDQGVAELELLPGKYKLSVRPALDQPLAPDESEVDVAAEPQVVERTLDPLAAVEFYATGSRQEPVAGVHVVWQPDSGDQWQELQSRIGMIDHPRTGSDGRFTAYVAPGRYRFLADRPPRGYQLQAQEPEAIELTAGETVRIPLALGSPPLPADRPAPQTDDQRLLQSLYDKMKAQGDPPIRGRFRFRQAVCRKSFELAEVTKLIESLDDRSLEEVLNVLFAAFPDLKRQVTTDSLVDEDRFRNITEGISSPDNGFTTVWNGQESIYGIDANRQMGVYSSRGPIHAPGVAGFWRRGAQSWMLDGKPFGADEPEPQIVIQRQDRFVEIDVRGKYTYKMSVEEQTGFLAHSLTVISDRQFAATRQLFPMELPGGLLYPRVSIHADTRSINLYVIDQAELFERLPIDAFVVAAPAGTMLSRQSAPQAGGGAGRSPSGVLYSAVHDVVAHSLTLPEPRLPKLRVGDAAPELKTQAWVDQQGEAKPPQLDGKLVLIDFWSVGCGSCVVQLPKVQAAAKHFAETDLAIIGLHDQYISRDELREFAGKKGLTLPLAIDAAGPENGRTMAAFDVYGIPHAVLIDREGTIAFIGGFDQALAAADKLLNNK